MTAHIRGVVALLPNTNIRLFEDRLTNASSASQLHEVLRSSVTSENNFAQHELEATRLRAELATVTRHARQLGIDLAGIYEAERELQFLDAALEQENRRQTDIAIEKVQQIIDAVDEQITEAIVAAECRARSVELAIDALHKLGYHVAQPTVERGQTIVAGRSNCGATAEVVVHDQSSGVGVRATFTDRGTAVPIGHPSAGQVCTKADSDEQQFTMLIARSSLQASEPTFEGAPTRSAIERDMTTAPGRKNSASTKRHGGAR